MRNPTYAKSLLEQEVEPTRTQRSPFSRLLDCCDLESVWHQDITEAKLQYKQSVLFYLDLDTMVDKFAVIRSSPTRHRKCYSI